MKRDVYSEVKSKVVNEYLQNVVMTNVSISDDLFGETIYVKITDNNKKHFKNKTLHMEVLAVDSKQGLAKYISIMLTDYVMGISKNKQRVYREKNEIIINEYKSE